ncbi:MAG: DUF1553 domain-containing protein, partial [Pirellulaceae bacterium]|nr:DUF1553 domain-containing protein [Pirellulaceae bacterium]
PYTAKDFYSMVAFFADLDESQHFTDGSNSLPTKRFPEITVLARWQRQVVASLDRKITALADRASLTAAEADDLATWTAERKRMESAQRRTMISKTTPPREIRILPRGNWLDDSGPVVMPTTPEFLPAASDSDRRRTRLDLANWLTDPDKGVGGFTARVFVNRFWYLLFGRGISSSLADFGGQGEPPTHPELLDQLAIDFMQSGWDVKWMIRRLVLSRTYQQSSTATKAELKNDPYNRFFARQSRYRLSAEMVRDNALSVSGLLVHEVGGASVKPYQPAGYYRHLNFPQRKYKPDSGANQWRRGVYTHWQRQFLHPMLKALDAPSREECTAQRSRSNTPLEALVLLNDPTMLKAASVLAGRLLNMPSDDDQTRLSAAFTLATTRKADATELASLAKLLDAERVYYRENVAAADQLLGGTMPTPDLDPVELAAWTAVSRAILNLYETVTRN